MRKPSRPSVKDVLALYDDCVLRYSESGLYGVFDTDEQMYELDFKSLLNLPREFKDEGIALPTARDLVDTCCDNTDIFNTRVWVNKKGTSTKSEEEANLLRKFGLGVLYRNSVEASISPIRVSAKHYWLYGLGIIKTVWDADRTLGRPERKEGESDESYAEKIDRWRSEHHDSIPIVIQGVHPRNIMLDPYYDSGQFVFETREELCFNVKQQFPNWGNPEGAEVTDRVVHVSFWSKDYRCELYDREPVLRGGVVKHNYGFIPYTPIDTGLGNLSSDNDLKKRYVGILRYVKDLLISESRNYSISDVILKMQAWPWGWLSGPNAQSITDVYRKFGEYNALPDGVELHQESPQVPPDALRTWLTVASNYLAGHAAPPAVRGLSEEGVRSGADRRLIIAQASTRYQYSNEAFRHGVAKVLSNCARIMKNVVPGDINVWAKTPTDEFDIEIKKDKMKEPFTFYVEFAPISEEDEYRRHDDLERLVTSGLVTMPWARRQMSNVDAIEMEVEEEVERLKLDPMVQQVISQYMAGKLMEAMQKRSTAESIGNPPPPLPAMPPEQGETPEAGRRMATQPLEIPSAAQEAQNRLKRMRSQISMSPTQGRGVGAGGNR